MPITHSSAALTISMALAACGGSSNSTPSNGFPQPAGTVAVNFTADDTANKVCRSSAPPTCSSPSTPAS